MITVVHGRCGAIIYIPRSSRLQFTAPEVKRRHVNELISRYHLLSPTSSE